MDDCCGAGYVHEFDAVLPPVQAGVAISKSTYDVSTSEVSEQYDILQSQCARRSDKECRPIDHGGCVKILEQFSGAIFESREADIGYHNLQLLALTISGWGRTVCHEPARPAFCQRHARPDASIWEICGRRSTVRRRVPLPTLPPHRLQRRNCPLQRARSRKGYPRQGLFHPHQTRQPHIASPPLPRRHGGLCYKILLGRFGPHALQRARLLQDSRADTSRYGRPNRELRDEPPHAALLLGRRRPRHVLLQRNHRTSRLHLPRRHPAHRNRRHPSGSL